MSDFLNLNQVANLCQVSPRTVRRWVNQGRGPLMVRMPNGRKCVFRTSDVEAWLERLTIKAAA